MQTILKELKDNPYDPVIESSTTPSADLVEYAEALRMKPVSNARSIVAICRKSGSRRTELRNTIVEHQEKIHLLENGLKVLKMAF